MAITAGTISVFYQGATTAKLQATPATLGTGPYTYQWYRSTTNGFTPGGGNILAGKTSLLLEDTGLVPNTTYYYKLVATDTGAGNATVTYPQATVVTNTANISMNAFGQSKLAGMVDLHMSINTVSVQFDSSQAGKCYFGQAVKMVDNAGGIPKVVACSADSDEVLGFVNYDAKTQFFEANSLAEISMKGNCIYLYALGPIGRGKQVTYNASPNGVVEAVGSSGKAIVGWAYDKATASGQIIRIMVETPSFRIA